MNKQQKAEAKRVCNEILKLYKKLQEINIKIKNESIRKV